MNNPTDSRDAAHHPSKPPVKQQQKDMSNSQILELCNFSLTPSLLISKGHCLSERGFRWNPRTKYQTKIEGVHRAVVPVEDKKRQLKKRSVK